MAELDDPESAFDPYRYAKARIDALSGGAVQRAPSGHYVSCAESEDGKLSVFVQRRAAAIMFKIIPNRLFARRRSIPLEVVTMTTETTSAAPQPIKKPVIRAKDFKGGYSRLSVEINKQGQIVIEGHDIGGLIPKMLYRDDYEFSWSVPADWKDTVLLHLVKDRFAKESEFPVWCKERGIPTKFSSWP